MWTKISDIFKKSKQTEVNSIKFSLMEFQEGICKGSKDCLHRTLELRTDGLKVVLIQMSKLNKIQEIIL